MRLEYWAWLIMPVIPALGSNSERPVMSLRSMGPQRPKTSKQLGGKSYFSLNRAHIMIKCELVLGSKHWPI